MLDAFRRHKDLKPEGIAELNEAGKKLARVMAEEIAETRRHHGFQRKRTRRTSCLICPNAKLESCRCSGEELAEGTVTRLAALKVLHELRPGETVTICLPLFLAGGEGDRAFADSIRPSRWTAANCAVPPVGPRCTPASPPRASS